MPLPAFTVIVQAFRITEEGKCNVVVHTLVSDGMLLQSANIMMACPRRM